MNATDVEIYSDWRHFVSGKKDFSPKVVPQIIIDSWKRSYQYDIDPFSSGFQSVSPEELHRRRTKRADLRKVALPYINNLFEIIAGSGSFIVLTDDEGVVIDLAADTASHSIRNFPEAGTIQSEAVVGTNGIGTALAAKGMIQIRGAEHWLMDSHSWTCNAGPIVMNNTMIGCLNLSTPSKRQNALSLGLVSSAITAITRELELSSTLREVQFLTQQQNAVLKLMENGVIIISHEGNILQANERAHGILKDSRDWTAMTIENVIKSNINFMEIFHGQTMLDGREISLQVRKKYSHLHVSTELIKTGESTEAMAILLHESKKILRMVNKISGSKAYFTFSDIIGNSASIGDSIFMAKQAAPIDANVLIMGESGTGKELIAQSIHNGSSRRNQPFIAVNCGALSRELIHSELFGYEGGAFTGAKVEGNPGKFELADGGTIFLDEIGELPLESQVALLRVIQTNEVTRIGSVETKSIDVRVISATNKDLSRCIREKSFREDLFFRINIFTIKLPPLSERHGDCRLLTDTFLSRYRNQMNNPNLKITEEAYGFLENYDWPGNIRQLENVIERAASICKDSEITPRDLPGEITLLQNIAAPTPEVTTTLTAVTVKDQLSSYTSFEQIQRDHLKKQLTEVNGNLRELATRLNVSRSTIYRKIERFHLNPDEFRFSWKMPPLSLTSTTV